MLGIVDINYERKYFFAIFTAKVILACHYDLKLILNWKSTGYFATLTTTQLSISVPNSFIVNLKRLKDHNNSAASAHIGPAKH